MTLPDIDFERLRALPYAERHPRMTFPGDPHFQVCSPCGELQNGDRTHDWTVADHPCWRSGGPCICGCADRVSDRGDVS